MKRMLFYVHWLVKSSMIMILWLPQEGITAVNHVGYLGLKHCRNRSWAELLIKIKKASVTSGQRTKYYAVSTEKLCGSDCIWSYKLLQGSFFFSGYYVRPFRIFSIKVTGSFLYNVNGAMWKNSMAKQVQNYARVVRIDQGRSNVIKTVTLLVPDFSIPHKKTS